ncbi:alpha/beta fold hydrolase [Modestobacter altitudinis]|uniref:alpha/beta fold hydrolase n=1 Tax=Modestobacter altitudinis TaxID=2213158 RepID=UPI00110CED01|nr:alpha/beta hydrolase [Modestobacter altitudinis]
MTATTTAVTAGTLGVPGARLHYEVRGSGPLVVLAGAPMGAEAFAPLAGLLAGDHTVLTTDPRGVGRSPVDDPEQDSTPELRADDLSRLIAHLGAGPAVALGSSGGAVTVLALAQSHPEQVTTVVAHEPPLSELVDDRDRLRAGTERIIATYLAEGSAAAWREFMAVGDIVVPEDDAHPSPPPEADRDDQAVADERHFFLHELRDTTRWQPDLAALRAVPTRVVVGIGEASRGELCDRTSRALAAALGTEPAMFPGSHIGFLEDPVAFAGRFRELLS